MNERQKRKNVKDIKLIMIEMIKSKTSFTNLKTSSLRYLENW